MLTTGSRADLAGIREPLMTLLDDLAERSASDMHSPEELLDAIRAEWLAERESRRFYDWRYYLVRYAGARSSKGDGYYHGRYDRDRRRLQLPSPPTASRQQLHRVLQRRPAPCGVG